MQTNNNIGSTSISELPVTNNVGIINQHNGMPTNGMPTNGMPTNGMPMNGMPTNGMPTNGMPMNGNNNSVDIENTVSSASYNELVGQIQQADKFGATQLPSRDIPSNTNNIQMDDYVKANYIPQQQADDDYIQNYETPENIIMSNEQDNINANRLETLYSNIQLPLLVSLLYFIFNLPIIRKYIHKYVPDLFNSDGNPNIIGYLVNSIIFGVLFYTLNNFMNNIINS